MTPYKKSIASSKKGSKQRVDTQKIVTLGHKRRCFFLLIALITALFFGFYSFNELQRKPQAKITAEKYIASIKPQGAELVFSTTRDNGCFSNDSGWLGQNKACAYVGEKLFKAKIAAKTELETVNTLLTEKGWNATNSQELISESAIKTKSLWLSYSSKDMPGVTLAYFPNANDIPGSQYVPKQHIEEIIHKISLEPDEYLFGIFVTTNY